MSFPDTSVLDSFSFLSPDAFVLPQFGWFPLPLLEHPSSTTMSLEVYSMHNSDTHPSYPWPIQEARFLLPPMANRTRLRELKSRSGSAPTWVPAPPQAQPSPSNNVQSRPDHPFHVAPQNRIVSFSIIAYGHHNPLRILLFTRLSTLFSYTRFLPSSLPPAQSYIPWED